MENNAKEYPDSCMNCQLWSSKFTIVKTTKHTPVHSEIMYGVCKNNKNKLIFIHTGKNTSNILTASNAVCSNIKKRVKYEKD